MKFANSVTDLIGGTPLVKIHSSPSQKITDCTLLAKLEFQNPGGSVKDRIGLNMIKSAEDQGIISPGKTTIIEATSGNTGIALAFACAAEGYKLILTMPETMSMERRVLMKAYGAQVELTPASLGMKGAIARAEELAAQNKDSFIPQQFNNPANPQIHYQTTAQEIWADTEGKVDIVISAVGTGGTITGIGKYLKELKPEIQLIAVEPSESPVLSGGKPGPHRIQGIGAGFKPAILDMSLVTEVLQCTSEQAVETARYYAREEGLLVGISSGAALFAASQIASKEESKNKVIVVIIPSNGERYLSSVLYAQEAAEAKALVAETPISALGQLNQASSITSNI